MYSHDAKLKKLVVGLVLAAILFSLAARIQFVNAQPSTITIGSDGSIDPPTDMIKKEGSTYVLSADLNCSIRINRNNILLDGANRTIQGPGSGADFIGITLMASNVTLKGFRISGWKAGVYGAFNNNTVANNVLTNNSQGVSIYANNYLVQGNHVANNDVGIFVNSGALQPEGDNNWIIRNLIDNNHWAIDIMNSNGTTIAENNVTDNAVILTLGTLKGYLSKAGIHTIYLNNFANNKQVLHVPLGGPFLSSAPTVSPAGNWNNDAMGNYWSDYFSKYLKATEIGQTGIGDTAYLIEESTTWESNYANGTHQEGTTILGKAIDHFPLVTPYNWSARPTINPSPTSSPTPPPPHLETNLPTLESSQIPSQTQSSAPTPSITPSSTKPTPIEIENPAILQQVVYGTVLVLTATILGLTAIIVKKKNSAKQLGPKLIKNF